MVCFADRGYVQDVWGHLRHVIVEEPEDFSHVIVFYVGSEGITEKCSYEVSTTRTLKLYLRFSYFQCTQAAYGQHLVNCPNGLECI